MADYDVGFVQTPAYTRRPRPFTPSLIIIHATRGHTTLDLQDEATINWFRTSPNRGGWGVTADALASSDGELWEFGDIVATHSAWSAGYGSRGSAHEWGADERAISFELAQPAYNVGEQPPMFAPATLEAAAWMCRQWCDAFDIPIKRVPYWSQSRELPVPRGFIGHEDLENGRKTGKHDPGPAFPWDDFLAMVDGVPEPLGRFDAMREAMLASMRMLGRRWEPATLNKARTRERHMLVIPRRKR